MDAQKKRKGFWGSDEKKIQEIKKRLNGMFCFTSDEIDSYMDAIQNFPPEGLDAFLELLEEGKKKQDDVLFKAIDEDKTYVKNLDKFLKKTSTNIKNQYEQEEQSGAEDVLKKL